MTNSSSLEFNEPDFPEYDSTPYGGGYDINITYGKPLRPSDVICYPRSKPNHNSSSPHGEDWVEPKPNQQNGSIHDNSFNKERNLDTPIEPNFGEKSLQVGHDHSSNGYSNGNDLDTPIESKLAEEFPHPTGYYGRQVPLPPSEYIEPCASLFGYWPCLLKEYQKNVVQQSCSEQQGYENEWKRTEEYFFGNSYPYGETRGNGVSPVEFNYGYGQHYVEQSNYVQEEYNQPLKLNHGFERHYVEQPSYVKEEYNQQLKVDYGYEKHYMEQPSYVQEEYNQPLKVIYGYEKHYVEQPSYVQEEYNQPLKLNYGYEKHYAEQPSYVQEEYNQPVKLNYGYEEHYVEQPSYVQEEYNEPLKSNYEYERHYVEQPSYVQEEYNQQLKLNYGHERHYTEQPSYVQEEYNQQLWSQKLNSSYYETYQEV